MRRPARRSQHRLVIAKFLFLALFLAIGGRAVHLQVLQGDKLMRLGQRQHLKEWIVLPKRGALFDRTGEPLALSLESQSVYARPHRVPDAASDRRRLRDGGDNGVERATGPTFRLGIGHQPRPDQAGLLVEGQNTTSE